MKRTQLWLVSALAAGGLAGPVLADPPADPAAATSHSDWHGHRGHHGHALMHVLKKLNLTPEQETRIRSIFAAAKPQLEALGKSTHQTHEALLATPPTDPSYPGLLQTAKDNAVAHVEQLHQLQVQIYSVLTPAQQAQIPQVIATEKAKWHAHHAEHDPV